MTKEKSSKKADDGNFGYVGSGIVRVTSASSYSAVVRADDKVTIIRKYKKISYDSTTKIQTIESFSEKEEIKEGQAIPKPRRWKIDKKNRKFIYIEKKTEYKINLTSLQYDIIDLLFESLGSYVGIEKIKNCWKGATRKNGYISDGISKLKKRIEIELTKKGVRLDKEVIESDGKFHAKGKVTKYKLVI